MKQMLRSTTLGTALVLITACTLEAGPEGLGSGYQALTVESSACRVDYTVTSAWGGGFGADIKITNKGAGLAAWTLTFNYPNGQRITSLWNGSHSQSGASVTIKDAGWNGALATGASTSVGFNGTLSGANGSPSGFALNGKSCEGGGSPGGNTGGSGSGGAGGGTTAGTSSGGSPSSGGTGCAYPSWQQGKSYVAGEIVQYQGALYIAAHDNPGYSPTVSTWFWDPHTCTGTPGGSGGSTGSGGSSTGGDGGFSSIVSRATFDAIFPNRNAFYTYDGLLEAIAIYPSFANEGSLEVKKREAAAFLANVAHETGNLVHIEEIAKGDYTDYSPWFCAPAPGQKYYGRGPIQLSWNYNYCAASQSIFGNQDVLRLDPGRVAREAKIAWASALWFWTTQTGAGSMTAHNAMVGSRGFGETIRTINGSLECNGGNPGQVQSRIQSYQSIASRLGATPGSNLGC